MVRYWKERGVTNEVKAEVVLGGGGNEILTCVASYYHYLAWHQ